ncbi:hypothetical protein P148_SR1C00001G0686 [candidate division SR1 bacterium RAAC1_SR1_1]|nr:hypothetical protein P148_SR1C00001G0686 [candidate division SR1 bacterium RAAC1_SR1_1]
MILKTFITQYISEENVEDIIFHSGSIIIKDTLRTILLLAVFYGIFYILDLSIQWLLLPWIFGAIGAILLMKFGIDIFNKGVDCIVLSKQGITFFARDGVFKYKTEFFGRDSIETISHQQNTFRDKLFLRGDIKIVLDHEITYEFEQVTTPKKQVKKIMKLKDQYLAKKEYEEDSQSNIDHDQIGILSDALSDVIKEYLEKKK